MIRIYSMEKCPYCKELKEMYDKAGMEYTDVDINEEENREEWEAVSKKANCDSVPVVRVNNTILAPEVGFDSINEAYNLTKDFLKS